ERRTAWHDRWGKASVPKGEGLDREENFRRKFWITGRQSYSKCYTCRVQNAPVPAPKDDPSWGQDEEDVLFCGCEYKPAALEMFLVERNILRADVQNGERKSLSQDIRKKMWELLVALHGEFSSYCWTMRSGWGFSTSWSTPAKCRWLM
ncbi:MAG: hypothetical protein M1823_003075, partial [Watsoniomyces obsoletus]